MKMTWLTWGWATTLCACVVTILCRPVGVVMLIKCLHNTHEALGLTPTSEQSGCGGVHLYSKFIGVVNNKSEVQGHPRVHRKLQASMGIERPGRKINKQVNG